MIHGWSGCWVEHVGRAEYVAHSEDWPDIEIGGRSANAALVGLLRAIGREMRGTLRCAATADDFLRLVLPETLQLN